MSRLAAPRCFLANTFDKLLRARLVALFATSLVALAAEPGAAGAFQLGLEDPSFTAAATQPAGYRALNAIDGNWVRAELSWIGAAPGGSTMPSGFDPSDPADPQYNWQAFDAVVRGAAGHGANLIALVDGVPPWAEGPNLPSNPLIAPFDWDPNVADFGQFMHAAAVRYSGHYPDPLHAGAFLPAVKYWEIWNEVNLGLFFDAPDLVNEYRSLLNAAYDSIKAVDPTAVVSIGGLAPVSYLGALSMSPLTFAAQLMCLDRVGTQFVRARSCPEQARFDVFSIHPYSLAATPTKHAYHYDDVLVGDLGKVDALLKAADTLHTVYPSEHHGLWVTEWSWFTNPPNTQVGDSPATAARYTAYSMYEMWKAAVSVVIWFQIQDAPYVVPTGVTPGGGLYDSTGHAKPMMSAFAFPFVAGDTGRTGFGWGRAPVPAGHVVDVEREAGHHWLRVASAMTRTDGTFYVTFTASGNANYRAHVEQGPTSQTYNSTPIPPKRTHLFNSG